MEYLLEIDVNYPIELHELHVDLAFLSERMKIDICEKLVCNFYDKKNCHQALNHGLALDI